MDFDIRAAGTPSNTNRSLQIQNVERIMQVVLGGGGIALQTGLIAFGELMKAWIQLVDFNLSRTIVREPEEAADVQTVVNASQALGGPGTGF